MRSKWKYVYTLLIIFLIGSCSSNVGEYSKSKFRLTEILLLDGSENMIQKIEIVYNELNKPSLISFSDPNGNLVEKKMMFYDKKGNLLRLLNETIDGPLLKTEYRYDKNGFLFQRDSFDRTGKLLEHNYYENDNYGNHIEWNYEDNVNLKKMHFLMEYDNEKRIVKSTEIDLSGKIVYFSQNKYDEFGNEISYTIFSKEGKVDQKLSSFYTENRLSLTTITDENEQIVYKTVYTLSDFGKPLNISSYNQYDNKIEWKEMLYDEKGNEIQNISYDFEGKRVETITKEYDINQNLVNLTISNAMGVINTVTRKKYDSKPMFMDKEEFDALLFNH